MKEDTELSFWERLACTVSPVLGAPIVALLNNNSPKKAKEAILYGGLGLFLGALIDNFNETKKINI